MKLPIFLCLAALALLMPACTTVHEDHERPVTTTSTTETTETRAVRTPVGGATTSTTVRSY